MQPLYEAAEKVIALWDSDDLDGIEAAVRALQAALPKPASEELREQASAIAYDLGRDDLYEEIRAMMIRLDDALREMRGGSHVPAQIDHLLDESAELCQRV